MLHWILSPDKLGARMVRDLLNRLNDEQEVMWGHSIVQEMIEKGAEELRLCIPMLSAFGHRY